MAGFVVREVRHEDFVRWLPLWTGYNTFYKRTAPDEVTRTTWARFFDGYEPVHALVAERGDQLIGLAHYLFHRNTSLIAPTCYMQDLFTAEAARGPGVGRALGEAGYARARAAGSPRVYWQTHETNTTAQALYDRVANRSGFIVYRKDL